VLEEGDNIEPITATKILVHAVQNLADKEKRKKTLIAIGVIVAIPVLFIMMMWYTITAPLRWLQDFFSPSEISQIEDARNEFGFGGWNLEAGIVEGFYCPFPDISWIVTSPFGIRIHPITGNAEFHQGVDISWYRAYGTPIGAIADGVVTHAGYSSSAGWWVVIYHGSIGEHVGVVSVYMHNSSNRVSTGSRVHAGDTIGFLGTSGFSTGAHLHLEIRLNGFNGFSNGVVSGTPADPLGFIGLPGMRIIPDEDDYDLPYEFYESNTSLGR